jgi:peptidoglycan-N-acetylglucosamine deacetylase
LVYRFDVNLAVVRLSLVCFLAAACATPAAPTTPVTQAATAPLPARLPPPVPSDPIDVALTVDDLPRHGPDMPGVTRLSIHERMLTTFAKHKTPAVYGFLNAQKLEEHPEDRAALVAWTHAGFPLGNHTYSHPDLGHTSLADYLADVDKNEASLKDLMGDGKEATRAWKVFRYPYLREGIDVAQRATIRVELEKRGYRIAQVTIDFFDWAYNAPYARCVAKGDEKAIAALKESYIDQAAWALRWADAAARELVGRPVKQVLLLHVGAFGALMLDEMLTTYEKNGARFVSLDDALADPIYTEEPKSPKAHYGNFLNQIRKARGTRSPVFPPPPDTLLELACR